MTSSANATRFPELDRAYDSLRKSEHQNQANTKFQALCDETARKLLEAGMVEESFEVRRLASERITFDPQHPLFNLAGEISRRKAEQKESYSMTAFSGFGGSIVKSGHLCMDKRMLENGEVYYIQFKLNPFAREDLASFLEKIELSLLKSKSSDVNVGLITYIFRKKHQDGVYKREGGFAPTDGFSALEVVFNGIGRIVIGNDPKNECLYKNVDVELNAELAEDVLLKTLYNMLSLIGLGGAVMQHSPEDDERIKGG